MPAVLPLCRGRADVKILVVDDHPLIGAALRQVLQGLDPQIEALEAQTGAQALRMMRKTAGISLVLLDLALPDADGFDILRESRERHPDIPVVVLSATDTVESVMRALDEGAMGYIPKSSNNQVLIGALRLVLAGGVYLPPQMLRQHATTASINTPANLRPASYQNIGFTGRKAQVLALVIQGKSNKHISRELDIAEGTVKIHVSAIFKSLHVTTRTQAIVEVSRLGLKSEPFGVILHAPGRA